MKNIILILVALFLVSCNPEPKKKTVIITKGKIKKQSEMAALMLLMYETNEANKKLILAGKAPEEFPEEVLKIHSATLTDPSVRKPEFKSFSNFYIENLRKVFEPTKDSLRVKHNNVINSCITCHQTTCVGPIPKIKKLLIQ